MKSIHVPSVFHSPVLRGLPVAIVLLMLAHCAGNPVRDKDPQKALNDMQALNAYTQQIASDLLAYVQSTAHSRNPAEINRKRQQLLLTVENAILNANQVNPYNGDTRYKDAVVLYLNTMYTILREDYGRIVDMQEVADQSYDAMEAYLLAREKASEKLQEAAVELQAAEKQFAADYDIQLIQEESETALKLKKAGDVLNYHNRIFLINFKSYKQELYLLDALNRNDVSALEQNREKLLDYAEEGLEELQAIAPYDADPSLRDSALANLQFYKNEAEQSVPVLTDFLLKQEQFEKVRQAFEAKSDAQRTREEVNRYNLLVDETNAALRIFNQTNERLNQQRGQLVDRWNQVNEAFLRRHIPR
ncbi:MAG: hypothetical protein KDK27_09835 [Leptospiraceae bacterium]|nr:hypothetical protein [Leptospiraceae bacterium]